MPLARVRPRTPIYIWRWYACSPATSVLCDLERQSSRTLGSYNCTVFQPLFFGSRHFPILLQCLWNWMHFPVPSNHLIPSPGAQVRWWKHCASIATAGSLVAGPIMKPISTAYTKPLRQPKAKGPSRCHQIFLSIQVLQLGSFVFFLHMHYDGYLGWAQ